MDHYKNFGTEDFVWDSFFRQWVLTPTRESDAAWNKWLVQNPGVSATAKQAREIVLSLKVKEPDLSVEEIDKLVKKTISRVNGPAVEREVKENRRDPLYRTLWFQLAASIIFFIGAAWWVTLYRSPGAERLSAMKAFLSPKTKSVFIERVNSTSRPLLVNLEDNSRIVLTPGSRLSYPAEFAFSKREVFLTGEAFFDISKDPDRPFLVYANELVTKVLGTSFLIKAYASSREVTVEVKTGRVSVFAKSDPDLDAKISEHELAGIILTPNQKIIFGRDEVRMVKTLVEKPEIVLPKAEVPQFEFEDTPASEVFASVGKAYGIDILYDEELLNGCPLTATLDNQTLHEKLNIICKAVEASYEILDGQIVVHSKGCRN